MYFVHNLSTSSLSNIWSQIILCCRSNCVLYRLAPSLASIYSMPIAPSFLHYYIWRCLSVQFSHSVVSDSPTNYSKPGLPVHHQLPESTQTHVHWVSDAIPTVSSSVVPFSSCLQSFPASGSFLVSWLFQSGGQLLELQLQHQSFQWIFRADLL